MDRANVAGQPAGSGFDDGLGVDDDGARKSWILTGSLENFRINVERGFDVIGFKERRRRQAGEMEPGDEIFFYVTGVQAFGGLGAGAVRDVRGPHADLAAGQQEAARGLSVAGARPSPC